MCKRSQQQVALQWVQTTQLLQPSQSSLHPQQQQHQARRSRVCHRSALQSLACRWTCQKNWQTCPLASLQDRYCGAAAVRCCCASVCIQNKLMDMMSSELWHWPVFMCKTCTCIVPACSIHAVVPVFWIMLAMSHMFPSPCTHRSARPSIELHPPTTAEAGRTTCAWQLPCLTAIACLTTTQRTWTPCWRLCSRILACLAMYRSAEVLYSRTRPLVPGGVLCSTAAQGGVSLERASGTALDCLLQSCRASFDAKLTFT